jgi:cell division septation protein DedD
MKLCTGRIVMMASLAAAVPPASAAAPAPARSDAASGESDLVKSGALAWDAGNFARALAIWRPLALAGDAYAQYNMAQAYRLGRGVPADDRIAQDWYFKAAQQDHPQAQANYGLLLFQNGDRKGGLPWLQKAADRGDPRAQYVVGTAFFNGDTLPKDWVRAYALMMRAAAASLPPAVTSLGEMDKYMSLQQRQQGSALARDLERQAALTMADDRSRDLVRATPARQVAAAMPAQPAAVSPVSLPPSAVPRPSYAVASPAKPAPPPPAQKPAARSEPTPVAGEGHWRVQVGAYADPVAAGKVWDGIARKAPGMGLRSYLVKAGAVTRLQAGPLASRTDANRACARIKATGTACFPVPAP